MKKFFLIFLCLTLTVAVILPTVAFADEGYANSVAEDIIYFLNPTAITAVDDYLFVADKIEDNRSAILCFDVSSDTPARVATFEIDEKVLNLSDNGSDKLYAVTDSRVLELSWNKAQHEISKTDVFYSISGKPAVDFAYGVFNNGYTEYYLSDNQLFRFDESKQAINITDEFDRTVACYAMDNYVYYIYALDGQTYCKRYDGTKFTTETSDKFNSSLDLLDMTPFGFFGLNSGVAIFGSKRIVSVEVTANACTVSTIIPYNQTDDVILDVTACNEQIFVLNNRNVIEIYSNNDGWKKSDIHIGSDTLDKTVPTEYTSFELVRTKGYPANIVFKTTGDNSLDNIETEAEQYIVIGYDGEENSHFYYVLVRDANGNYKFGWVKKSDNAESVSQDDKLEVVNTTWSDDKVEYRTAFTSLYAVWIYDLPCSKFSSHPYEQTASNKTEVTVLQQFEEITESGKITWLYVSYKDGDTTKTGFVKETDVGKVTLHVENTTVIAYCKINSTLFSSVKVYMFSDPARMTDQYLAKYRVLVETKDENGETVKEYVEEDVPPLYSGHRVSVISEENGVCLVQIVRSSDGAIAYGYVYANQLIPENGITTNAAVGLSLLLVAIVLAVVLVTVFVQRKKKKNVKADN